MTGALPGYFHRAITTRLFCPAKQVRDKPVAEVSSGAATTRDILDTSCEAKPAMNDVVRADVEGCLLYAT